MLSWAFGPYDGRAKHILLKTNCRMHNFTPWCGSVMNKIFFPYLISMALSTGCTEYPASPASSVTAPGTATAYAPPPGPATTSMAIPTTTAYPPPPEPATPSIATPTPDNYGLYTDADLQIYADTLDVRIQEALKKNDTTQAQTLGQKRQELIAEFNRRGLKRHPPEPTTRSHSSRRVNQRETRVTRPRNVNPPTAGLPGEEN
jgi:hypothetical protein